MLRNAKPVATVRCAAAALRFRMTALEKLRLWSAVLAAGSAWMASDAAAAVRLPRLVGDDMVLQRNAPLDIWGWADAGESIRIRFRGRTVATRADENGRWSARLAPLRAGGPDDMQIDGSNSVTLHNILVGDVWLASGQSNMQFPLASDGGFGGADRADEEIRAAVYPKIRLFMVDRDQALRPKTAVDSAGWTAVTPETVRKFSAVAYFFGRDLFRRYGVPVGLIESCWGGTAAETWMSQASLQHFPEFQASIDRQSHIDGQGLADYAAYQSLRDAWYTLHGREDRGRVDGRNLWAEPGFDATAWPATAEPQPWPVKAVKDFDGTLWFRKEIEIPEAWIGGDVNLHLSKLLQTDTTYFNGHLVGETTGDAKNRDYRVPQQFVVAGRNVIVVRLAGEYLSGDGYVGMLGTPADMHADIGAHSLPLAGSWSFQPGPDVSGLPEPPPAAEFHTRFPRAPTLLWNAMIAPLTRYRIKGVIWYQGESNASRAAQYRRLFPALIDDWRGNWGYELPFLFVQLAGYGADGTEPAESAWAELREAQAAALALPGTGMAVAVDVGDAADVHPRNKQAVGRRLALAAAKVAYGENVIYSGPTLSSMHIEGAQIRLTFVNRGSGLRATGAAAAAGAPAALRGFAIAAADGRFVRAQASIDGADVIVYSERIRQPTAVRYDWGNTPDGNLYNAEGLPAVPFRTDRPF